jgi:hypothetical protein
MTVPTDSHLSTFALDTYFAAGRPADRAIEAHLAACDRCRAYLAMLESFGDERPLARMRLPAEYRKRGWTAASAAAAALALAAGVVLLVRGRSVETQYVGGKGSPAVQLLVHRGAATWVWDGRSAVHPGDALAVRPACEGMDHVTVASPDASGWRRIAEVTCPLGSGPLPFTLVVDARPGSESFAVVMSRHTLDDDSLRSAIARRRHADDTWVETFVLPKEPETDR